jgi:hypothetical protein
MKRKNASLVLKGKVILSSRQTQLNYTISLEELHCFYPFLDTTTSFQNNIDYLINQVDVTEKICFSSPAGSIESYKNCIKCSDTLACLNLLNSLEEHCANYGFVLEYVTVLGKVPTIRRTYRDHRILIA